ncbi:MAG TPA: SDR family NAD(P)-dependent oxidoreductase [Anaerolineae bacterium]|nr:SDR family NAD(P)-dependent oxidoreductase [Anaerolineae bacterium]
MAFWPGKKVLVTGGTGFIGSHLVEMLVAAGARVRVVGRLRKGSLENLAAVRQEIELLTGDISQLDEARRAAAGQDIVMHLGAKLTGIGYNVAHSGDMFYQNSVVNLQMMEAARLEQVERYLCVSSACVYRRSAPTPTAEDEGFIEDPEPTNFGYGWAKRLAEVQARAYAMEYPMQIAIVRPYNAYGPRDDFDWETSHVIPATIRKVFERDRIVVWGDGSQLRTFVHARDVARGMMLAMERPPQPDPINLASDELVSIKDLVLTVRRLSGRDVPVEFDTSKPAGQAIRQADLSKAQALLGYRPQVSLEEGLAETIDWYRRHILSPSA